LSSFTQPAGRLSDLDWQIHHARDIKDGYNDEQRMTFARRYHALHSGERNVCSAGEILYGAPLPQVQTNPALSVAYRPSEFGAMSIFDPIESAPQATTQAPVGFPSNDGVALRDGDPPRPARADLK